MRAAKTEAGVMLGNAQPGTGKNAKAAWEPKPRRIKAETSCEASQSATPTTVDMIFMFSKMQRKGSVGANGIGYG